MASESWRIETHATVFAVEVVRRGACWAAMTDDDHAVLYASPRGAVQAWAFRNSAMGMVLAPGEPTRTEMATQIAAETRRANDAQTESRALAEAFTHDLRDLRLAAHAAGWDGTNATTGNMVAAIRAEALREALREALAIARAEPGVPDGATQADFNAVECARRIADGIEKLMGGA